MMDRDDYRARIHEHIADLFPAIATAAAVPVETVTCAPCEAEWSSSNLNNWVFAVFLPGPVIAEIWHDGNGGFDMDPLAFAIVPPEESNWTHPDAGQWIEAEAPAVPGLERLDNRYVTTCHYHSHHILETVRKLHGAAERVQWLFHQVQEGREIAAGALAYVESDLREAVTELIENPST